MRLVGMALLAAWLVAWAAAPKGEPHRQTSVVGAVAVAGADDVALAWLELTHGADGTLHVVTVDGNDRLRSHARLRAGAGAVTFRLADAGGGAFVLATERLLGAHLDGPVTREVAFHRFAPSGSVEELPPVRLGDWQADGWQMTAAGDELVAAFHRGDETSLAVLGRDGAWDEGKRGRTLVGAGGGHVVLYEVAKGELTVAPGRPSEWTARVGRPACFFASDEPTVTSVVGLRGGYARLSRRGAVGCVDGIRYGLPFAYRDVPLAGIQAARLEVDGDGRLAIHEEQEAQVVRKRVALPADPGGRCAVDERTVSPRLDEPGVRYRLFGGAGRAGVTSLATRVTADETQVVLERNGRRGDGRALVMAPSRRFQADHRPTLRRLALVPLLVLLVGAALAFRLRARLGRLAPLPREVPLRSGEAVLDGELATDADAPAGGLRIKRGSQRFTLFVEGAAVLRASDVRPRTQPRGDAVDVASGATVVCSGTVEPGTLYRAEPTLRARRGDLVLVGCTIPEARAWLGRRLLSSLTLLALAATVVLSLVLS